MQQASFKAITKYGKYPHVRTQRLVTQSYQRNESRIILSLVKIGSEQGIPEMDSSAENGKTSKVKNEISNYKTHKIINDDTVGLDSRM